MKRLVFVYTVSVLALGGCRGADSPDVNGAGGTTSGAAGTGNLPAGASGGGGLAGGGSLAGGAAGAAGIGSFAGAGGAAASAGGGVASSPPDCAAAFVGEVCDSSFLSGTDYRSVCDLTAEDDPKCRRQLECENGAWKASPFQLVDCRTFPPCDGDGTLGFCRDAEGVLCYRSTLLTCGKTAPVEGQFPTFHPPLGSTCLDPDAQVIDCGLNPGFGSFCVQGVWVRGYHSCK